jgi:hypothetical protein
MAPDLNPQHLSKPRQRSKVHLRASGHAHPANDNCKPTVRFQYLQLLPMMTVFLVMVLLLWLIAIAL